jgi:hypothetical protein
MCYVFEVQGVINSGKKTSVTMMLAPFKLNIERRAHKESGFVDKCLTAA